MYCLPVDSRVSLSSLSYLGVVDIGGLEPRVTSVVVRLFEDKVAVLVEEAFFHLVVQIKSSQLRPAILKLNKIGQRTCEGAQKGGRKGGGRKS